MKTLVFGLRGLDSKNRDIICNMQKNYSISFRKLYNNIDCIKDESTIKSLRIKSSRQIEYLIKEVVAKYNINKTNKAKIQKNIDEILDFYKKNPNIKKLKYKDFKKLNNLKSSLNSNICFGNKKSLKKISKFNNQVNILNKELLLIENKENKNINLIEKYLNDIDNLLEDLIIQKEIWRNSRLLPLIYYGESHHFGNRFFNLKLISEGLIIFKPEFGIKINLIFKPKKGQLKDLKLLQILINNKEIPVTVKLTTEKLYISFDEAKLNNTFHDINKFYETIKDVKIKDDRTPLIRQEHLRHETFLKEKTNSLDRYLSIDLNPGGIGYTILEKDLTVIKKGYIDVSQTVNANKRRYETSIMTKELFKLMKHYRCHTIISEDLNFKSTNLGSKSANRQVNNFWNRNLIEQIIDKRCKEGGYLRVLINPVYTSFIGNILHNEYDPVASSIEIGRRGINKFTKGSSFYPEFETLNIINHFNDLSSIDGMKMYEMIKECETWKDLKTVFSTSGWNYRRKLINFSFLDHHLNGSPKSLCRHLHFHSPDE